MEISEKEAKLRGDFIYYMCNNWGQFYFKLAGMQKKGVRKDSEIVEQNFVIQGGDWVLYDKRGKSGTYAVSHESFEIKKVTLVDSEKYKIDYSETPLELKVGALELMHRYQKFFNLFTDYAHREYAFYLDDKTFEDVNAVTEKFNAEKDYFENDPHLALYWLMHFGFALDKRYHEVKEITSKFKYPAAIKKQFNMAMAFFDNEKGYDAIDFGNSYLEKHDPERNNKLKTVFLNRRSYLIYESYSCENENPDNLDFWWKSVKMFPQKSVHLICRMYWLKRNVEQFNCWDAFEALLTEEDKNISLISYLFACNPNYSKAVREENAVKLLNEFLADMNYYKFNNNESFVQAIIWDVRELITDKALLEKATDTFFIGKAKISSKYKDLLQLLGRSVPNEKEILAAMEHLKKMEAEEPQNKFEEVIDGEGFREKVIHYFNSLAPNIYNHAAEILASREVVKAAIFYTCLNPVENKAKVLYDLLEVGRYESWYGFYYKELFKEHVGKLIKDDKDENIEVFKELFSRKMATVNKGDKKMRVSNMFENYLRFFLGALHYPSVFEYIIGLIKMKQPKEISNLLVIEVCDVLFTNDYDNKINSTLLLSKEQVETMCETLMQWTLEYEKCPDKLTRVFSEAENPFAIQWIQEKIADDAWFEQFSHIRYSNTAMMDKEIKWRMNIALKD